MSSPINRTIPLSPAWRLACDVLHFGQKVPLVVLERRMRLADVVRARAAILTKPTWFAVFAKAYGIIAARWPALRRSYLSLPWPPRHNAKDLLAHLNEADPSRQMAPRSPYLSCFLSFVIKLGKPGRR
jgi:hypothetical protein